MQIIKKLIYTISELFERNRCRNTPQRAMKIFLIKLNCTVSLSAGRLELLQQILGPINHRFHLAEKRRRLRKSSCNGVPNDISILDTVQRSRRFEFGMRRRRIGERCAFAGHSRIPSFRGSVCDVMNISSRSAR